MTVSHLICHKCGKELGKEYKYCPFCGSSRNNIGRFIPLGSAILYVSLLLMAVFLYSAGLDLYGLNPGKSSVYISLATALGPVSVLGLIYQFILNREMRDITIKSFSDSSSSIWEEVIAKSKSDREELVKTTLALNRLSEVGLVAAFSERSYALKYILDLVANETDEIYLVGTSFRGLFWPEQGDVKILNIIAEKIKSSNCKVRFLLTHPAFVHLRQDLESVQRPESFHIAQEILDTVVMLRDAGIDHTSIRFVKATPTLFGIMTSRFMLINPYPLQRQAYTSVTFVIEAQKGDTPNPIYKSFKESHFEGVWDGKHVEKLNGFDKSSIQLIFEPNLIDLGLCDKNKHRKIDYNKIGNP